MVRVVVSRSTRLSQLAEVADGGDVVELLLMKLECMKWVTILLGYGLRVVC